MKNYPVNFSRSLAPDEGVALSDFSFPWLERPSPETVFRAVHDDQQLAFSFAVVDEDLVLDANPDRGQAALGSDRVELFFASSPDLTTPYYGAEMDPSGRVYDYRATFYRQIDPAWSFSTLKFEGSLTSGGYEVQGTIELAELRSLDLLRGREMITGVYRAEFSHDSSGVRQDWISWIDPGTEQPDFHVPASFGLFSLQEG